MPPHLKRGQNLVGPSGVIQNVRLKRHLTGEQKIGRWKWKQNPFRGTREFNGLRVMMALIPVIDQRHHDSEAVEFASASKRILLPLPSADFLLACEVAFEADILNHTAWPD